MAEKTDEQIAKDNSTTIDALSVYLDDVAPAEQFGSNPLHRIGNIQPIQTQEDLFERGLIGEDGLLTPKGDLYKTLSDNGLINPDGTLPEKSAAFMMDEDDALKPENLNAYVIRRENKIGEKPMSWGDTFGGLGELLWDAGAGLGTMVKLGIQNIGARDVAYTDPLGISSIPESEEKLQEIQKRKDQLLNRSSIAATSFVENSIKAFSETGAIVNLAGAAVSSIPARIMGDEKIASDQVNAARQAQDRLIKSNQDAAIGSTLDAVFQTATYVPEMARVKSEMPKAEFDKIIKQTGAAGQIFADPVELAKIGTVMKLATRPIVSRLTLNAERVIGKASDRAARLAEINVEIADVERAKGMTQNAAELARKTADAARERFDLNGDQLLLQRANAAEEIFNRSTAKVSQFTADGARLANEAAELTAETQKLASRVPVAAAQAFEATAKAGRELKSVPFRAFAATIEPVSRGLIALDDGLDAVSKKLGIGAAYDIMTSKVGQAVGYGAAIGLGPAPALIGAAGSVLKSGPFLQRLADTSRILGTEMAKAQSQVPFFQRVANNPMISPAHRSLAHLSDLATLGGFLPDITRRAAKGAAVSFPLDFAAQYMSDGGEINQNTFKQAFAESVLIGGSSAALGGMFAGTKQRHRDLAVNDEINFRNEITAPDQKRLFTSAPSGIRRAVGTFAAVFPSVNIQFTQEGGGFHDENTIGIDLNSSNPLKYLLAHEVKHLLVHRNQMHTPIVAMMLGDGEAGGIMRAPDGTLNPEFEAFAREYNNRQIAAGRAPVSLGKIAEEFFVEAGVEDMARMSESGELGAIASRTEARRMIGRLFNSVFDKSTVLKDFHLRIGGLMDQGGKLVQGNGLLNPGITQTQEMRNMTRNMLKRAAGRSVGQFEPLGATEAGNKGEGPGINLPINPDDKAMIEKIGPVMFEMETVNGRRQVVRDSDGNPVPVDFNTQLMRSRTGALIQEAIGNRPSTYQSSPNEMRLNDEGIWEGYLPPDIIEFIKKKGSLNQEQIRMIEHVNSMIKNFKGDVALVINHPATSRNKKGKLNYKTLKATLRQVVPISWNLTKDGNLTLGLMSVTQLKSNIDARISSRLGQQLYQGNRAKLMVDIGKVMELHQQGKRTDEYFDTEYGAAKSQQFKNFVNSVFGLMTKKQGEANPIFSEENLRGNGVYKTYRADRISQATKMTGDKYPFQYDFVVQNMMPNGLPTLDDQGRPVAMNRLPEPAGTNGIAQGSGISQNQQETNGKQQPEIQAQPVSAGTGGPETQGGGLRGQGGLPRGAEQLQSSDRPGDSSVPLEGLPATVTVPGLGRVTFGPNETARRVATDYAKSVGIDYNPPKRYAKVDEARATRIAAEYDKMPHAPNDPKVKASYDAMIKETLAQWDAIKKTGLKVEAIPAGAPDPYAASPRLALLDVRDNNHLWFFPTENGFGGSESAGVDISGNPLMAPTGEVLNGHKMLANDVFRIVHDYFGHIKEGVGFRADGEENAWRSHSAMYSDLARPAMTAETRGQNSWVNYGPFGEFNKTASGAETQYAPQKTGIMPDWVMSEGAGDIKYMPEPVKKEKKKKERQVIGEDRVIDKGDKDTLDVIQAIGAKTKEPSWKDDKPVPVSFGYDLTIAPHIGKFSGNVEDPSTAFLDDLPYDLNGAEKERVENLIKNGVVDYLANDMVERTRIALKDPAIAAGKGWYSRMRSKLLNALGDVGREIFSQFLGATSAQTPVDENFQQAVDANEGMNSGRYDRHRKGYLKAISAESKGTLDAEIAKTRSVENIKGIISDLKAKLPSVTKNADKIAIYAELKSLQELIEIPVDERTSAQRIKIYVVGNDLLPRRSNGAKFNANSGAVLKVIAGVWLNNRKSPKTPNFAGNLSGRTVQATIDIWAARFLRRQIYGGQGVPWRIQPKSEVGVSNEDFAFAQVVMDRAAKKLGMNPDDLQAILWFAEKDVWDKKGWTKNEGAKKSSFDDIFDIFFPEGKKPLSFAEGSALIKATKDREKAIAKEEEKAKIKAEAKALGLSIAALNRMKKAEK